MPSRKHFPDQSERSVFTLDQAKALTSAIRSEVFWAFNPSEAHSAAEIAQALGKSAQTVHYHVHELAKVGLLLGVETRKKRARTETLYVQASRNFVGQGPKASREFRDCVLKGFTAITRSMVREEQALHKVFDTGDDSIAAFNAYSRSTLRLSPERAAELKLRLVAVLKEMEAEGDDPGGVRVHAAIYMKPTQAESRAWLARQKPKTSKRGKA